MEKIDALYTALHTWGRYDERWGHGPEGIMLLARTGLFTHMELAAICDRSPYQVRVATHGIEHMPRYRFGEKFDPTTLDSIVALLEHYDKTGMVAKGLLDIITQRTSLTVVSRMTGIGVSALAGPDYL